MRLLSKIRSFLADEIGVRPGDGVVVAFSGGPDSTALLWALQKSAPDLGLVVEAVHVDHGIDPDSRRRARSAAGIARALGVVLHEVRVDTRNERLPGEAVEATARRLRYGLLESERRRLAARFVLTAHHADDQVETLLIRMAYGSGIEGLTGIRSRRGTILRPLLEFRRTELAQALAALELQPVNDPTNQDLGSVRNRIRHQVWPRLLREESGLDRRLLSLAATAVRARRALEERVERLCPISNGQWGPEIELDTFLSLPREIWPHLLARMNREADRPYPPPAAARRELERQVRNGGRVECECGDGWRWEVAYDRIGLYPPTPPAPSFAYTVVAPGECWIRELSLRFRIRQGEVDEWMFQPSRWRVGLVLPIAPGASVVVRSRKSGDRIRPFGCSYRRRLKDVLIDRRVPRRQRSRLALLEVGTTLAWVPGVTIDDRCRVTAGGRAWIAELERH